MKNLKVLMVMLVVGFFCCAVAAQARTCLGVVQDATGAAIPDAKVSVTQNGSAVAMPAESDSAGKFSFQGTAVNYDVVINSPGFKTLTVKGQSCDAQTPSVFRLVTNGIGAYPVQVAPQPNIELASQSVTGTVDSSSQEVQTVKLSGHLQNRAGADLAAADVSVKMGNHEVARTSTDANGIFSFDGDPGTYDVSIKLAKYAAVKSEMVTFHTGKSEPIVLKAENSFAEGLEYGVFLQGGNGLTEDDGGFHFLMVGVHAGKVLTDNVGSGILRGNFEYAVEVMPFWQAYTPTMQRQMCIPSTTAGVYNCSAPYTVGGTYTGASITPIILRWNLAAGTKWKPWIQGAGGVIWTNHKFPGFGGPPATSSAGTTTNPGNNVANDDTSIWNFTPQFGVGAHYFVAPKRSIDFSANAVHISSASLGDKNPGVNASVQVSVGYSWWK